jgi:very-short-patch-repair endonuclease
MKKKFYCKICKKEVSTNKTILCQSCYLKSIKGKNHPNYIKGKPRCEKCGKELSHYNTKLCQKCYSSNLGGLNNPGAIDGRTLIQHYCKDCGKKINYKAKRCLKCEMIRKFKAGLIKSSWNKTEQKLYLLLPKSFKYIGNGKFWIQNFNPDFIDKKRKLIIEMFGDYWHNRKETKLIDKIRLKTYKENGYKTLIIWEHELKNTDSIKNKIKHFKGEIR